MEHCSIDANYTTDTWSLPQTIWSHVAKPDGKFFFWTEIIILTLLKKCLRTTTLQHKKFNLCNKK